MSVSSSLSSALKPLVPTGRTLRIVAVVSGLIGILLCGITPLLPVKEHTASIDWPRTQPLSGPTASVTAPLTQQTAQSLTVRIPCATMATAQPNALLFSTVPTNSYPVMQKGLVIMAGGGPATGGPRDPNGPSVSVTSRGTPLLTATHAELQHCKALLVTADLNGVHAELRGIADGATSVIRVGNADPQARPQVDGIFTTLTPGVARAVDNAGLSAHIEIDTRFDSTPSIVKIIAMVLGVLAVLISLVALALLDWQGGYHRRVGRRDWKRLLWPRPADIAVTGVLVVWHFLGAGTPDDGYVLNMGRGSAHAGYLLDYYRFFGVPEAPFDWYYTFLADWSHVSAAGIWMRIPSLVAGLISWFVLSRVILPRIGPAVRGGSRTLSQRLPGASVWAVWSAAAVFTAFWMAFASGLRSESMIILGSLLTWWGVEQAIATRRMLPAAMAAFVAALTLALAPHGVIAIAMLVAGSAAMLRVLLRRSNVDSATGGGTRLVELGALLIPVIAAVSVVSVIVFRDQTLMTVIEAARVRWKVGTTDHWYQEFVRYYFITVPNSEGALTRRVPVLILLAALLAVAAIMLRRKRIPGIDPGPVWRGVSTVFITMLLLQFTPTKWTIQFGIFAGIAAALAAVAAVAVAEVSRTSVRNLTLFISALLFALAASTAGINAWPWARELGISWYDKAPSLGGTAVSTPLLALAVLVGAFGVWQHLRMDYVKNKGLAHVSPADDCALSKADRRRLFLAPAPIAIIAGILVVAELLLFVKAAASRNDSYTVLRGNFKALGGDSCAMADRVLVEPDSNAGQLVPVAGISISDALAGKGNPAGGGTPAVGFTPNGVAGDLSPDLGSAKPGQMNVASSPTAQYSIAGGAAGTLGGNGPAGVNGSTAALPFGLDPARTPVLGSYGFNTGDAHVVTDWYQLPDAAARKGSPLIAITAAGSIMSTDNEQFTQYGQLLQVEFGRMDGDRFVPVGSRISPIDPGDSTRPNRPWRNLRVPMNLVPPRATAMRIVADDANLDPGQWLAFTPPRIPHLQTLQQVVGSAPSLIDFTVGDQFPCQQPVTSTHGVDEIPQFRILPDRIRAVSQSKSWMAANGGGPLGTYEALTNADTMSSYLQGDLYADWGELEKLTPVVPDAPSAHIMTGERSVWGWHRAGGIWVVAQNG